MAIPREHDISDISPAFAVEIAGVNKYFGDFQAVAEVSLQIRKGEFFALLGPSGCGKTTLLRIISGLELPSAGTVMICGRNVAGVPACDRPVNTVFQSYALFPHMSVRENISFGLKMKELAAAEIISRVDRVMETVRITDLADRFPNQLSGGQKQRVALARAIVNEPEVLLLDEPLGALDLKLRKELQMELISLQRRLGITFICVTHDQEEALSMADRIAVMNQGRIEQLGDAESLYEFPQTRYVGNFLGTCNIIEADITSRLDGGILVDSPVGRLRVDFRGKTPEINSNKVSLAIRPEKVNLLDNAEKDSENCIQVEIAELLYIGSETHYQLKCGNQLMSAEIMNSKVGSQGYDLGQKAYAYLPPAGLILLQD